MRIKGLFAPPPPASLTKLQESLSFPSSSFLLPFPVQHLLFTLVSDLEVPTLLSLRHWFSNCSWEIPGKLIKNSGSQAPPLTILIREVWHMAWESTCLTLLPPPGDADTGVRETVSLGSPGACQCALFRREMHGDLPQTTRIPSSTSDTFALAPLLGPTSLTLMGP